MGNQNNGGNNVGATGSEKKQKNGFFGWVKGKAKSVYVWATTSKAGKVLSGGAVLGLGALGAKKAYDIGFQKGAASVTPTTVYITAGVDDDSEDEEEQEPEEEVAAETTAE